MSASSLNRRDILAGLATLLDTLAELTTVVRSYNEPDILQYKEANLPLLHIVEPVEDEDTALTAHRQIMTLNIETKVYFVSWAQTPSATYEALVTKIRNLIGGNFHVNQTAIGCWVTDVTALQGQMPLYSFGISLRTKYYLDQQDV